MIYTQHYESPLGGILLAADDTGLTGLWFEGQKYFARTLDAVHQEQETAVLSEARRWLDVYFGGQEPDFTPPLHPAGPAAMETLTVIAYNQPVSRAFIEQVRGVDSSSSVSGLLEKGLIEEAGRLDLPGRPVAFRTTDVFLRCFGLSSLEDLPPVRGTESEAAQ